MRTGDYCPSCMCCHTVYCKRKILCLETGDCHCIRIYQYFIYGREDETELIKAGLKDKMDKMILRNIYTESKIAESVEERENARKDYLDRKEIPEDFRW